MVDQFKKELSMKNMSLSGATTPSNRKRKEE
jgi:hypothetical protein